MLRIVFYIDKLSLVVGASAATLVLPLGLIMTYEALARFLLNLPTNLKVAICTPNRRIFYILGVVNWEISVRLPVKDVLTSCRHEEAFGTFSVPRAEGPRRPGRNGSRWGTLERQTDFHFSFNSTFNLIASVTVVIKCVLQLSNP